MVDGGDWAVGGWCGGSVGWWLVVGGAWQSVLNEDGVWQDCVLNDGGEESRSKYTRHIELATFSMWG